MSATPTLRALPSVHELLDRLADLAPRFPHTLLAAETRAAIESARGAVRAKPGAAAPDAAEIEADARRALEAWEAPSLRRVINATGVILHTNLGRAPLAPMSALAEGYSNLEYDLAAGARGKRDVHVGRLLERILGAPAVALNNNAAATYLALNELAAGGEAIVSRGELIEIGDGFRIPDIMTRSGAVLREVGATNRTRLEDYRAALNERTRLIMIVHPSNFRIEGFTGKPARADLAKLAREAGVPLYEDLGSGCLADLTPYGVREPRVQESLADGVSLVSFSGDKLLGGPQAGILAGDAALVARLRRNPMFRALRLDKLILAMLESTLRDTLLERWDRIPALRMIALPAHRIGERARAFAAALGALPGFSIEVIPGQSLLGGGSTPEQTLPTWNVALQGPGLAAFERRLRAQTPPVVARLEDERLLLDLRTIEPAEELSLLTACRAASATS
ncbi:MAG: L-seryl-tRNA(Sec) selenium transferase [Acidobacteria bacterium]|nr:L-seryl-tRNA(Sec) selenium transferase [Acidobacteriota bacterium]